MDSDSRFLNRASVANIILKAKPDILKNWEMSCRAKVEAAKVQSRVALRDSLPDFLDRLVDTLNSDHPKSETEANSEVAREHAEDRATQPEYTLDQVITEYHILRSVILDLVEKSFPEDAESRKIIHEFIDLGITKSAVRYIEIESYKQKSQTDEIQATKDEAEKASATKSAFLANMSHEIRSPLGAIMGFVSLLKDAGISPEEVSNYLSIIDRNSVHLLRIIDDILDLTKVEAGKMLVEKIEFSLLEFLSEFSSLSGLKARENGIIFESHVEGKIPEYVVTDPTRLRQILSNVVGNAIKFTEKGSVELLATYRSGVLEFQVTDTGRGISEEQRLHLFQAFAQADSSTTRKFGGTGLGLILTKKLCQALGGDFRLISSEVDKGSVFQVSLPVTALSSERILEIKKSEISSSISSEKKSDITGELKGLKILLVEDSPDNQFLIERILHKTGAIVTIASEGSAGVEAALTYPYDVILMDIQMPIMDGHEAVRILRQKGYSGIVVALTAHAMKEERERAIKSGFSHFLSKPINRKNMIDLLASFVNRK